MKSEYLFDEAEAELCYALDKELYFPMKEELQGRGTHHLGIRKEDFKKKIHDVMVDLKNKLKEQRGV